MNRYDVKVYGEYDPNSTVTWRFDHAIGECLEWIDDPLDGVKNSRVRSDIESYVTSTTHDSWAGGSFKDTIRQLRNGVDGFNEWMKNNIQIEIPVKVNRRKRVYSDSAGEIDMDRRWEDYPFETFKHVRFDNPVCDVYVAGTFSCIVDSKEINKYGMKIFEIVDALERAGKSVNLYLYYYELGPFDGKNGNAFTTIKLKGSDEYVNPQIIATCLTSFFYRKVGFSTWLRDADKSGYSMPYGLCGCGKYMPNEITVVEGNKVWFEITNPVYFNYEEFEAACTVILKELATGREETEG